MKVSIASVELPDGVAFEQYVFRMPRSAMTVALNDADEVLLIWRHRFIMDRWTWELPGGYVDPDEEPAATAARELREEAGWIAGSVELLTRCQPLAGSADFENFLYLATDLHASGRPVDVNEAERIDWVRLATVADRPDQVCTELRNGWGIAATAVEYVAAGAGSFNWRVAAEDGSRWFVKADPVNHDRRDLDATYETAAALRDGGLDFVHAAIRDQSGRLRRRVSPGWKLSVFTLIDGWNPDFLSPDRVRIAAQVGRLHGFTPVPDGALRWRATYGQPELRRLLEEELNRSWTGGPYGESARALLTGAAEGVDRLIGLHDRLVEPLADSADPWVTTHGEPHGGNTMLDRTGRVHLIDCDDMMVAPRERDLWLLLSNGGHQVSLGLDNTEVVKTYQRGTGPVQPRPFVLELFRASWHLDEITTYGWQFRGPHDKTDDTTAHWHSLNQYVPVTQNWPELHR